MGPLLLHKKLAILLPKKLAREGEGKGKGWLIFREYYRAIRDLCRALRPIRWPKEEF